MGREGRTLISKDSPLAASLNLLVKDWRWLCLFVFVRVHSWLNCMASELDAVSLFRWKAVLHWRHAKLGKHAD